MKQSNVKISSWTEITEDEIAFQQNMKKWMDVLGWRLSYDLRSLFLSVAETVHPKEKPPYTMYLCNSIGLAQSFYRLLDSEVPTIDQGSMRHLQKTQVKWTPF